MRPGPLDPEQLARYERDGYLPIEGLFEADEIALLLRSAREDRALDQHSFGKADGEGGRVRLSLWNHPGDGIYGMFARCRRVVDACEQILDDEVYHYHSKMIMKDPLVGGAWAWHQDYGYWNQNGVLSLTNYPAEYSLFSGLSANENAPTIRSRRVGLRVGFDQAAVACCRSRLR